jgi:flagellar hook-associated protein 1 FlgK
MMSGTAIGTNGGGVTVTSIRRLADAFVDARQRDAYAQSAFADGRAQALTSAEQVLGEPSDTGLAKQLTEFWSSWQGVANSPDSIPARQGLLSKAATIVGTIQQGRLNVDSVYTDTRNQLNALVTQVNSTAAGIADLNDKIRAASAGGQVPNELVDQRDQLVLMLSRLTGATARNQDDGTVSVSVNGIGVVMGTRSTSLQVSGGDQIDTLTSNPLQLTWSSGAGATFGSGQLGAVVDSLTSTYPDLAASFDDVATTLATSVNTLHSTAQDLDGTATGDFFTGTTAKTLAVAVTNPRGVGAAAVSGSPSLDNSIADQIAQLSTSKSGPDIRWGAIVAAAGVSSAQAQTQMSVRTAIQNQADANRASASGVSIDEEMSNMLMYQRSYEGAGRVMTTIDEMLDTLINRTGQVGR